MAKIHENVQNYYGHQLQQTIDLNTDACYLKVQVPCYIKEITKKIHPEVVAKYYGCGSVFPPNLEGCRVLDLGCGAGRDVYILSSLIGPQGYVVGVDMTKEQLDIANRFIDYHTKEFGFEKPNVEFHLGKIEEMTEYSELESNSFDVIVSNCVVNLTPDKRKVLEQVYAMLKPGGEFYFSDMYADQRIPEALCSNTTLWGEGLAGALLEQDLLEMAVDIGFTKPCLISKTSIKIKNEELKQLVGDINYSSCTYRLFKNKCIEDPTIVGNKLGAFVTYEVPITHCENEFIFDQSITLKMHGLPRYFNAELFKIFCISRYSNNFKYYLVTDEKEIPAAYASNRQTLSDCSCR